MRGWTRGELLFVAILLISASGAGGADTRPSAQRGKDLVHQPLNPPFWSMRAYRDAWKQWGDRSKPENYAQAFCDRYGLREAPYDNGGLPMGFTKSVGLLRLGTGLGSDCLLCHAGKVAGQTMVGLGNSALDMQSLYEELAAADGLEPIMPLPLCNARGTSEASNFAIYLMQYRDTDLRNRLPIKYSVCPNLCEDIPAWWHVRRKRTIYHLGAVDSRSVRTLMPFLLIPGVSAANIKAREPDFADIRTYLASLEPPRYPFAIDRALADKGHELFDRDCRRCHGTYGPQGRYPNKRISPDVIGTDPTLARAFAPDGVAHYLASWFAREHGPKGEPYHGLGDGGYQAPPLDGIWATAPYLHNGSVPTLYHLLNSSERPRVFRRSFRGDLDEYDRRNVGLRFQTLSQGVDDGLPAIERRKVYDTTQPGRGNGGHTFGDRLNNDERMAVIEYLKTL